MFIALSGTPGTGKTSVSNLLRNDGYSIIDLNKLILEKDFVVGIDNKRDSKIIDINSLDKYFIDFNLSNELVFLEGHLSHHLRSVKYVVILRCHPHNLEIRLQKKGWKPEKIKENVEAEILDIILCETVEIHPEKNIFEIDTTKKSIKSVSRSIIEIVNNKFLPIKKYNIGKIDWSEEILKDF